MRRAATDMADVTRRLAAQLRAALQVDRGTSDVLSVAAPVPALDPLDWLAAQPLFPKVYWQARHHNRVCAGVGSALSLTPHPHEDGYWESIESFLDRHPAVSGFYGMRFDARPETCDEWRDFEERIFLVPEFMLEQEADATVLRVNVRRADGAGDEQVIETFRRRLESLVPDPPSASTTATGHAVCRQWPEKRVWLESVRDLTAQAGGARLRKVVLARRLDVAFDETPNPMRFMRQFRAMESPAYFFCWQPVPGRAFVGSSPEQFFKRTGGDVFSEALAGTRSRGNTVSEDLALRDALLHDPKERQEHALVHEHIRGALAPLCTGLTSDERPTVLQLVLVQHLLQKTAGVLQPGVRDGALLAALHPTPAVGGVPVEDALAAIRSLEPFDRGWYAAPLGLVSRDHTDLTVAIRSGLLHGNTLSLYCGAGIVAESDPEAEWQETEIKFANFLNVIRAE